MLLFHAGCRAGSGFLALTTTKLLTMRLRQRLHLEFLPVSATQARIDSDDFGLSVFQQQIHKLTRVTALGRLVQIIFVHWVEEIPLSLIII